MTREGRFRSGPTPIGTDPDESARIVKASYADEMCSRGVEASPSDEV